jgi:hypothetical protein
LGDFRRLRDNGLAGGAPRACYTAGNGRRRLARLVVYVDYNDYKLDWHAVEFAG